MVRPTKINKKNLKAMHTKYYIKMELNPNEDVLILMLKN